MTQEAEKKATGAKVGKAAAAAKAVAAVQKPVEKPVVKKTAASGEAHSAKPEAKKAPVPVKPEAKKPTAKKDASAGQVKVTQVVGSIARRSDQQATLIGLGLNKRHRSRVLEDTPSVRGMIYKVRHLVKVEKA